MKIYVDDRLYSQMERVYKETPLIKSNHEFTTNDFNGVLSILLSSYNNINSDPDVKRAVDTAYRNARLKKSNLSMVKPVSGIS